MNLNTEEVADVTEVRSITNSAGLKFLIYDNGGIKKITQDSVQINLFDGSPFESKGTMLYLRVMGENISSVPLFGPESPAKQVLNENFFQTEGEFQGVHFSCRLMLAEDESSWLWNVQVQNASTEEVEVDLICTQDVGMFPADAGETNELYVSQYLDYESLLHDKYGYIVCCRQNEHGPNCIPWLALGSLSKVKSFSTDGLQFFGRSFRETGVPVGLSLSQLQGRCQQEFGLVALQEDPFVLEPGQSKDVGFFAVFCEDHPQRTTSEDMAKIEPRLKNLEAMAEMPMAKCFTRKEPAKNLFSNSSSFIAEDLTEDDLNMLFGADRRYQESTDGQLLSFFYGENRHVVMRRKELLVDRPHGHIVKTGTNLTPDLESMSSTVFMFGVFHSYITQGNISFNRFLGLNTNPMNIFRHTGQRMFIKQNGGYEQLSVPSAFEITLGGCRWIYKQGDRLIEISSWANPNSSEITLELKVLKGSAVKCLISTHLAAENGWSIEDDSLKDGKRFLRFVPGDQSEMAKRYPGGCFKVVLKDAKVINHIGGDEVLFEDGQRRGHGFLVLKLDAVTQFEMKICGDLVSRSQAKVSNVEACDDGLGKAELFWNNISSGLKIEMPSTKTDAGINEIAEILPWFAQNSQIHYLIAHGIEQYSGGGWGTRDTPQGPLEMLLALGHYDQAREILLSVFSNQNEDGNWPQWWLLGEHNHIRASDSHGDVLLWPILALAEYIRTSNDIDFLEEPIPFYCPDGSKLSESVSLKDHALRAIEHIKSTRLVDGTSLLNYSDGDWNDSMQPANSELKHKLISSWTVALGYQSLGAFAEICHKSGNFEIANEIETLCDEIRKDFNKHLVGDGVVAGFGLINEQDKIDFLLHPSDSTTGIHYRLLPMIRGIISGIFTPDQVAKHAELIETHLKGPDGARLMDKPPKYCGGTQNYFKRAESSPFFGREIGLMYTHAHLRYAEAMARIGDAEAFIKALRQVVPIDIQTMIPQANIRQANCYYSSSDADFPSRYDANESYDDVLKGNVGLKGGWRIYSSGPGIFIRLVISHLFGIRHNYGCTVFDPVLTRSCDGLSVQTKLCGRNVKLVYGVSGNNNGVSKVSINGVVCEFARQENPYRIGGAVVEDSNLQALLNSEDNIVEILS